MGIAGEVCRDKLNREVSGSACGTRAGLDNVAEGGIGCDLRFQLDRGAAVFGAGPQDYVAGRRIAGRDTKATSARAPETGSVRSAATGSGSIGTPASLWRRSQAR